MAHYRKISAHYEANRSKDMAKKHGNNARYLKENHTYGGLLSLSLLILISY